MHASSVQDLLSQKHQLNVTLLCGNTVVSVVFRRVSAFIHKSYMEMNDNVLLLYIALCLYPLYVGD